MTWIYDQPLTLVLLGGGLIGGCILGWVQTGRQGFLYAAGAAIALLAALLALERLTVTDQEAIRAMLAELAADVQANNHEKLLAHIAPDVPDIRAQAQGEMPRYLFREARITRIHKLEVDSAAEPRTAETEFNVVVSGSFRSGPDSLDTTVPRWVRLQLMRDKDGRWKIRSYDHAPPQEAYLDPSLKP